MIILLQFILAIIMMMMVTISKSAPYSGGYRTLSSHGTGRGQIMAAPMVVRATNVGGSSGYGSIFGRSSSSTKNNGGGVIPIAIHTKHNVEYKDVPSSGSIQTATVEVGARSIPINIIFRSASSSLNVLQRHQGSVGDTQESSSEDEPHRLLHTVTKPIIQEIHEVISPYRKILQEVHPVQEEIKTVVAKNSNRYQPAGQGRPTTTSTMGQQQHYVAAASSNKKHHVQASPIIIDNNNNDNSMDSMEDDDDVDFQKLIQNGNAIVTSSSILKGTDLDGKSIAKAMDQSLSKSLAAILKTPTSQKTKQQQQTSPTSSSSSSISVSSSSSSSSPSSSSSSSSSSGVKTYLGNQV
uniref:Uncharacterized protein n=1 Tax=Dermatophagoides pteronyssinus TaxID=6956 RepID=A0A6P6Y5S4_DERPT|nr:putative uncharacterized protein DDB_G0277255 [Dermatophagoides pteronyssinus]